MSVLKLYSDWCLYWSYMLIDVCIEATFWLISVLKLRADWCLYWSYVLIDLCIEATCWLISVLKLRSDCVARYAIDRKDISSLSRDWEMIESNIDGLSLQLKSFNPETDYLFRIRATNEYGTSDPSMAVSYYGKASKSQHRSITITVSSVKIINLISHSCPMSIFISRWGP